MNLDTIPALFVQQAERFKERALFLVKRGGRYVPISWAQAAGEVDALAAWMLQQQIQPGDRIILLSENRPEWAVADLAVQSVGGWTVPIYPILTAADLAVIARDCQPVLGVASSAQQLEKLREVQRQVPSIQRLILIDGDTPDGSAVAWAEVLREGKRCASKSQDLLRERRNGLQPLETCTLIYTSGTTGEPKGVMLSHRNFLSNVDACQEVIHITEEDVHLSFLPLCHVFERMAGWYLMMRCGATIAYAENIDTVSDNMREIRPTMMLGVPRFFEKLHDRIREAIRSAPPRKRRLIEWALRQGREVASLREAEQAIPFGLRLRHALAQRLVLSKLQARLGGRLRFFVSGGAPLSKEIGQFFFSIGIMILEGYGLTETSPVIAVNRPPTPKFGAVGPPLTSVEVRIADDGEVLTRGPHVMQGYYHKPEVTQQVIVDGWFHTGDIGHLDSDGYLSITDRKKDLIKTAGGKYVAPQKLEGLFIVDEYISQALVFGDRERYCVALIVPDESQLRRYAQIAGVEAGSLRELVEHPTVQAWYWSRVQDRQKHLAGFEQVKRIALLGEEFSQAGGDLTPTLKAKRQHIAMRYASILRSLYESPTT